MHSVPAQKLEMCEHGEALRWPKLLSFILAMDQRKYKLKQMEDTVHQTSLLRILSG